MVVNDVARLVVDPERFPGQTERMSIHGRGALYARTCDGSPLRELTSARDAELLSTYFTPYAHLVSDLVDERLATTDRAVIIDVHSYPSEPSAFEDPTLARPEICLGVDDVHTPPALLAAAHDAFSRFPRAIVNEPYVGCYVPTKHYRTNNMNRPGVSGDLLV